jgi:hypothetical protein
VELFAVACSEGFFQYDEHKLLLWFSKDTLKDNVIARSSTANYRSSFQYDNNVFAKPVFLALSAATQSPSMSLGAPFALSEATQSPTKSVLESCSGLDAMLIQLLVVGQAFFIHFLQSRDIMHRKIERLHVFDETGAFAGIYMPGLPGFPLTLQLSFPS